jgi:acyl carrier protein
MTEQEIYATLNQVFREVFEDPGLTVSPQMSAADIADWDSFNHINIIVSSEIRFGVKFKTSEIEALRNVGDFARLIATKRRAAAA